MDVATLVQQMHDNLVEIHQTIAAVESSEHHAKLAALEAQRDALLGAIRDAFDEEHARIRERRVEESMRIADVRRQEDEERERRRLAEDAELEGARNEEDEAKLQKLDADMDVVEDDLDRQMDEVERAAHSEIEAGEQKIKELEDKRREINRLIDEKLQQPLLSLPSRKKTRYARRASRARGRSSPVPFKVASDEAPAEAVKAASADAPPVPETEVPATESRALAVEPSSADAPADASADALVEAPKEAPKEASSDAPVDASSDVSADVTPAAPTETVTEAPKDLPTDAPADAPADAPTEALTATPAEVSADVPAATSAAVSTETPTAAPKDLPGAVTTDAPADSSTDSPTEASTAAPTDAPADVPADVSAAASTDASTEVPADAPTDVPAAALTDAPADVPAHASADALAETPSEAPEDAPTTASTDYPADLPKEMPTDAPMSIQTDSPVAFSTDAPKEASTDALDDVATKAVEAKPVEPAKLESQEVDATAVETPAAEDAETGKDNEEIAAQPVKPVDDGPEETSKAVTENPAEAEALKKVPQETTEPVAASEDSKPADASDEVKDTIPEGASKDLTPEPKIVADETDATEADSTPGATEAPAVEAPAEVTVSEAQPAAEDITGVEDDAPITDTPTAKAAEASTSDSHVPLEESLSKDVTATESASDKDDAPDAKAPIEAMPAAPEALSVNVPEAPEKVSDEPSAKLPEEAAAKGVPVDDAPAEAAAVASPEDTAKDASEEPTSNEEPKAESTLPEVSAKEANQAVIEEAAAPEVDTSKAIAKDAPADVAATSAAPQAESTSPEAAAQGATDAEVPAEEAVTKDAPVATVAAETFPATPGEATEKAPEEVVVTESPKVASLSYMSAVVPEEALDKASEETSATDGSEVVPEKAAEAASEKALDADIPVPSSTASSEEASKKQAEQAATAEASDAETTDAEATFETSPAKVEEATKVTDEAVSKDAPVAEISAESPQASPEVTSEKLAEESATKASAPAVPEDASDDKEPTAKDTPAIETSAAPPVETAQASHEEAEEEAAEEPTAKDAPVAKSLPEVPAAIPQASPEDTSIKASPEIDDKSATDSKTSSAPAEEKASNDEIPSEVSSSAEPTAEVIQADVPAHEKPSDDLPVVSQLEEPEVVQDKTADFPKVLDTAPLAPPESSTVAQEENPAISKAAVSPLAVQEESGIGLQASTKATDNNLPLDSHSGSTSQETADDKVTTKDESAVAKAHMGTDNAVVQNQIVNSDDAVSDATEGPNSPRASLHDSEDSYTGESVVEPLEAPEVLSAATKKEPSRSSVPDAVEKPAEESGVRNLSTSEAKAQEPSTEKPGSQPRDAEAAGVPEAAVASEAAPTGTETTLDSKPIEGNDNDRTHVQEETPAHVSEAPQQPQLQTTQDQELQETPVVALEEPESTVSQPKAGGSSDADPMTGGSDERADTESERQLDIKGSSAAPTKQHSGPELDYDSADESEGERDAPAAAKEGTVAATGPISDSSAPLSEGTLSVPSIRLNEEKDNAVAPGTPIENIYPQDMKTAEAAEQVQPSSVENVPEAPGLASASGQSVDLVPSRQSSRSPLPVENTTVDGQEALFDDESVATDNEEDLGGNKIKESIVSYNPDEDEGPPTARLPVDGITRFRGNEVKSYEHLRDADGGKIDLDLEQSRHASGGSPDSSSDLGDFTPRDVTNVTWRDRSESVNSYSTMSSTPSSPVQSVLHSDRHDSTARDAWPASLGAASRSRGYSQLTNNTSVGSTTDDFDPFRYDASNMVTKAGGIPSPPLPQPQGYRPQQISQPRDFYQPQESGQPQEMPQAREAASQRDFPLAPPESPAAANRSSLAGSPMFAKLRGMFEGQPSANQQQSDAQSPRSGSPTPSRPSSALFMPVGRERSSSLRKSVNLRDDNSEQSSLLGANEGTGSSGRH